MGNHILNNRTAGNRAFTLAETLITLTIVGVLAALTIPTLYNKYQDYQFKVAYKKAYSDLSQALAQPMADKELTWTPGIPKQGEKLFQITKSKFKVAKDCPLGRGNFNNCWANGDTLCGGSCGSGNPADGITPDGQPSGTNSSSFIDDSGRSWASYFVSENLFLVDTNGLKGPNLFGKDRWIFTLGNEKGDRIYDGDPSRITIYITDIPTQSSFCKHPPCYYYSWLYK